MFTIFRIVASLVGLAVIALAVLYFLPHETKLKTFEAIAGILPESLKSATEEIILTPSESREKIIGKVEENLETLKAEVSTEIKELIEETEDLLTDLKAKNDEQSITEIVKTKLANQLVEKELGTTTVECKNE